MRIWAILLSAFILISCGENRWNRFDSSGLILPNGAMQQSSGETKLSVEPELGVAFDCVLLGCKQSRSIRIANGNGDPIVIHKIELSKESSPDFTLKINSVELNRQESFQIAPRDALNLEILYQPADAEADAGFVIVDWQSLSPRATIKTVQQTKIPIRSRVLGEKKAKGSDTSLNFGYVRVNEQKMLYFPIENTSTGNAVISISTNSSTEHSAPFIAAFEKKLLLNPGQKASIPIIFSPKEEGVFDQEIVFSVESSSGPRVAARCLGTSVGKTKLTVLDPKENMLDFGTRGMGSLSKKSVLIRNEGFSSTALDLHIASQPENVFFLEEVASRNEILLAPMESVELSLVAWPKAGGKNKGLLKVSPSTDDSAAIDLPLSVFSLAPHVHLSNTEITFPNLAVGWESEVQYLEIDNDGVGMLMIDSIALSGESSSLLTLVHNYGFPIRLAPGDPAIRIGVKLNGHLVGEVSGQIQIQSNAVDSAILPITVKGQVQTCKDQCVLAHSESSCLKNKCAISQCLAGWHDADLRSENGCECREDYQTHDIGDTCADGMQMGVIGDRCFSADSTKEYKGTIHDKQDIDLFFVKIQDAGSLFCDIFGDSFEANISLASAPPGLVLCANFQPFGSGCGGYRHDFDPNLCGTTRHIRQGYYKSDDSIDVTAWVMWHPDAQPVCGEYTIMFRGKK